MKTHLLIILLILISFSLCAQETDFTVPDSLMMKLKEFRQNDDKRAQTLIDLIEYCFDQRQNEAALPYIKELRNLKFYTEGDYYQTALCDYYYACYLGWTNQLEDAMEWTDRSLGSLENAMQNEETQRLFARIKLVKSHCYFRLNLFSEEYNCLQDGIEAAEIIEDSLLLGKLYNNLGLMYQNIFRIDESFEGLYKSIRYYPNSFSALLNLGITHHIAKQVDTTYQYYDSAYIYMDYALEMAKDKSDSILIFHRIGCMKSFDKKYDEALDYLYRALEGYDQCKSSLYDRSIIRREIALTQKDKGNLGQAMEYIDEAIQMAELGEDLKALVFSYGVRSNIEKQKGNYKAALEDAERLMETEDRISKLQDGDKLVRNEQDLIKRKAQEQLRFEQYKAEQLQRITWIITGIFVFFCLLLTILIVIFNRKRRKLLEMELNVQHREMATKALNQMHVNEVLKDVVNRLKQIQEASDGSQVGLASMIRDLNEMVDDGSEKNFDFLFTKVHPEFYNNLKKDFPDLTTNDLRLCAFIKAKLSIKEIAELNHMNADSVKNSRSRLRKKMGLTDINDSLDDLISKY